MQDDTTGTAIGGATGAGAEAAVGTGAAAAFGRLYSIVARLRAPDGCPWDREQTPPSLRGSVVEEAYELVEAIDEADPPHVAEEAGDLFLLATMICYMHEQKGAFSVADSLRGIGDKLVRRHPHVFGEAIAETPDAVLKQWDEIKEKLEGRRRRTRSSTQCRARCRPSNGPTNFRRRRPRSVSTGRAQATCGPSSARSWRNPSRLARLSPPEAAQPRRPRLPRALPGEPRWKKSWAISSSACQYFALPSRRPCDRPALGEREVFAPLSSSRKADGRSGKEMCAENMGLMDGLWNEAKSAERA